MSKREEIYKDKMESANKLLSNEYKLKKEELIEIVSNTENRSNFEELQIIEKFAQKLSSGNKDSNPHYFDVI